MTPSPEGPAPSGTSLGHVALVFLRLGATAFGGPAMMAHFRAELVRRRGWLSERDFAEGMALTQIIPGATMVQMATYSGHRVRGASGALVAAIGFVFPAFVLMVALAAVYSSAWALPVVRPLFRGLGAVVVALIFNACLDLGRTALRGWQGPVLAVAALAALALKVSYIAVLAGCAILAALLYRHESRRGASSG
jgi:chromate transporter